MIRKVEFLSAVILTSKNHERLAEFYRDIIGIPLEEENHDETIRHYGCELGDIHFAIHPIENFDEANFGVGSVKLAFEVFNMGDFLKKLMEHGIQPLYHPKTFGGSNLVTAIHDPDGNYIEFTQLSDDWYLHLEKRKHDGFDIVQRWKNQL